MAESGVRQALHANGEATTGYPPSPLPPTSLANLLVAPQDASRYSLLKLTRRGIAHSHPLFKDHVTSVFSRPRLQNLLHTHHAHRTHLHIQASLGLTAPPPSTTRQIFLVAHLRPTSTSAIHHGSNPFRARCRKGTCRSLVTRPPALPRPPAYNYIHKRSLYRRLCACLF